MKFFKLILLFLVTVCLVSFVSPKRAAAGSIEVSAGLSYNRTNYSAENHNWTRRLGGSIGYHFTDTSEIEVSVQDIVDRTHITDYEDTTFHDMVYSASWVQSLVGKNFPVQPYIKGGVGQLNRDATGTYAGGSVPALRVDSVTGVGAVGLRIYLTRTFAIRGEVNTYLTGGDIKKWKDNVGSSLGLSIYF